VAPETDDRGGKLLAARIAKALNGITSGAVQLSATIGQAVYPNDGSEAGQLLEAADRDLRWRRRGPDRSSPRPG
jgi:GGDEF domain-containing protein